MWLSLFAIGFCIALLLTLREPIWAAMGGVYLYFGIPMQQFYAPNLPYQLLFWVLAVGTCWRYYGMIPRWNRERIEGVAHSSAGEAVRAASTAMKEVIIVAVAQKKLPGEIRQAGIDAAEAIASEIVMDKAPPAINLSVLRAVRYAIGVAADAGEQEGLAVLEHTPETTRALLIDTLEKRIPPVIDNSLYQALEGAIAEHLTVGIGKKVTRLDRGTAPRMSRRGDAELPPVRGPIEGVFSNSALWLHLLFIASTFYCGLDALIDQPSADAIFPISYKLMIPMLAIVCAVRTARHFRMLVWAWMFGVWHIAMNGVSYWLRYGGRADSAGGQGNEANFLGCIIVSVAPIAFGMAIDFRRYVTSAFGFAAAGAYVLGLLASGSRGALISFFGSMGYWVTFVHKKQVAIGLGTLVLTAFTAVAPPTFWERMGTIIGHQDSNPWVAAEIESSKKQRLDVWKIASEYTKKYPLFGIGPGNFLHLSGQETEHSGAYSTSRGLVTHNTWLQLTVEWGIVGSSMWFFSFFFSIWCYRRARLRMTSYPGWEWFPTMCLGLEAGSIGSVVCLTFVSGHLYDYNFWHMVFGPLALQIARETGDQLDFIGASVRGRAKPPPRPRSGRSHSTIEEIDLSTAAPLERE